MAWSSRGLPVEIVEEDDVFNAEDIRRRAYAAYYRYRGAVQLEPDAKKPDDKDLVAESIAAKTAALDLRELIGQPIFLGTQRR